MSKPVVFAVPGVSAPSPEAATTDPVPEPQPRPQPVAQAGRLDPREVLREAMANIGQGRHYGNALVDWLEANGYRISVMGVVPDVPMQVFSEPDVAPSVEKEPFGLTDEVQSS